MATFGTVTDRSALSSLFDASAQPTDLAARANALLAQVPGGSLISSISLAGAGDGHTFFVSVEHAPAAAFASGGLSPAGAEVACYLAATPIALANARSTVSVGGAALVGSLVAGASKGTRVMGMLVGGTPPESGATLPSYFSQENTGGTQDLTLDVVPGTFSVAPFPVAVGLQKDFTVGGASESEFTGSVRTPMQVIFGTILVNPDIAAQTYTLVIALNGTPIGTGTTPFLGAGAGAFTSVSALAFPAAPGDDIALLVASDRVSGLVRLFRGAINGYGVPHPA